MGHNLSHMVEIADVMEEFFRQKNKLYSELNGILELKWGMLLWLEI